jgi:large subunit ribosomal protein L35
MPKIKTNRGAAKRFKITARGKVKRRRAGLRHILTSKARKRKRHLRRGGSAHASDVKRVRRLMPYAF